MRYTFPSLKDADIDIWLDNSKSKHNGFGGKEFRILVNAGLNNTNLAKAMNVKSTQTIKNWIAMYKTKDTHN